MICDATYISQGEIKGKTLVWTKSFGADWRKLWEVHESFPGLELELESEEETAAALIKSSYSTCMRIYQCK